MLAKSLSFLANANAAGIVLGARVPIILTSRADSLISRLASCAVAGHGGLGAAQVRPRGNSLKEWSMGDETLRPVLAGLKALVIGVANDDSIAYGLCEGIPRYGRGPRDHLAQ